MTEKQTVAVGSLTLTYWAHEEGFPIVVWDVRAGLADPLFSGHIRFDGCINWETSPDVMLHFCDPDDADEFREVFRRLWELPGQLLGDTAASCCSGKLRPAPARQAR
jgi:hypothetical protein